MNVSPSHRIKANVKAKAIPLNAKQAIRGSPSPLNVLAMMPAQDAASARRLHDSDLVRFEVILKSFGSHNAVVERVNTTPVLKPDLQFPG